MNFDPIFVGEEYQRKYEEARTLVFRPLGIAFMRSEANPRTRIASKYESAAKLQESRTILPRWSAAPPSGELLQLDRIFELAADVKSFIILNLVKRR